MPDIIVTTPKSEMANAAREAADARLNPDSHYFRTLHTKPIIGRGDRVYYIEDGYVRGFCVVDYVEHGDSFVRCATTNRDWYGCVTIYMRVDSWHWIEPIPMKGFRGWKYYSPRFTVCGDWLADRPKSP